MKMSDKDKKVHKSLEVCVTELLSSFLFLQEDFDLYRLSKPGLIISYFVSILRKFSKMFKITLCVLFLFLLSIIYHFWVILVY